MKKILALILVALFALTTLSLVACGSINNAEVSVLWSGKGVAEAPDSLINCIDRAMYIENISYKNYGANGDADAQYEQAKTAVEGGCAVLIVEPVKALETYKYIELAKDNNIPIILIGDAAISLAVEAYNKIYGEYDNCVIIRTNSDSLPTVQGKLIADYVKANFEKLDRNDDGKISYVNYTSSLYSSADEANKLLTEGKDYEIEIGSGCSKEKTRTELVFYDDKNAAKLLPSVGAGIAQLAIMEKYNDEANNTVELIITDNDATALEILVALQSKGFNTDKLTTHCIPVFTVGFETDYKGYVLSDAPENEDAKKEHLENNKYLCDLTTVEDKDVEIMIWNTKNVIASGRLAGTVIEDQDAIAEAIASVVSNFVNEKDAFDGLDSDLISESGKEYLIPYIAN